MTYLGTHHATAAVPHTGFGARPSGILRRLWKWIRRPTPIKDQRLQLNQLSDQMLKDIGLHRCDIDGLAASLVDGRADPTRRRTMNIANFTKPSP